MTIVADPVRSGWSQTSPVLGEYHRFILMSSEVWPKRLQLLRDAIPQLTRVTVLSNPDLPWYPRAVESLKAVAPSLSIQLNS